MSIKILIACLLCIASFEVIAGTYDYVDYSAPDSFENGNTLLTLDTTSKEIRSSDWTDRISVCDETNVFYCFSYPAVSFYVPKKEILQGQKWNREKLSFEVLRKEPIKVFGLTKDVWVIKVTRSDRYDFFYYSEIDGLLAMKHENKSGGQVQFFMVVGKKGFPR